MKLIFDVDGTLLDSKPRVYELYKCLVPGTRLDFHSYWSRKRRGHSNLDLLEMEGASPAERERFLSQWLKLIEEPELLKLDRVIAGIENNLARLSTDHQLIVCTNRQNASAVDQQLSNLGLKAYFNEILVTEQKVPKSELLRSVVHLDQWDWIIGDTGRDILEGSILGIRTCAVLTGFHGREALERYFPSQIVESASIFNPKKFPGSKRN